MNIIILSVAIVGILLTLFCIGLGITGRVDDDEENDMRNII